MRTLVVVPTYQEAENVTRFLGQVREVLPSADILVADDNSPDGTGQLAEKAGAELGHIQVLHRPNKAGLGAAYRAGFAMGLAEDYDVVIQMDCDFSHDPAMLPRLLAGVESGGADCVVGSRYVPGGSTPSWPWYRSMLSRWGNRYTSAILDLGIRDSTSGFRVYRAATLRRVEFGTTRANGYAFQTELAYRMVQAGLSIVEMPITFVDRAFGKSKMSARIISESMALVTFWGLRSRVSHLIGRRHNSQG